MKRYDTVIFDMDGTLLNTIEDIADSVNHTLGEYGCPLRTLDEVRAFVGNGLHVLMERAVPKDFPAGQFEQLFSDFKAYYLANSNHKTRPYDGVQQLVAELSRRGYRLAIVSNKNDTALNDLRKIYFPEIAIAVGDRDGLAKKPSPEPVLLALSLLGSSKERSVYIGDSEVDFQTAQNTQMDCIMVSWGFRTPETLHALGAENIAANAAEVLNAIEGRS